MDTITPQRMAAVFNEWARRYSEATDKFDNILDADGKPITDYGLRCAIYFQEIADEMDTKGAFSAPVFF